jgi:hypothetical protein
MSFITDKTAELRAAVETGDPDRAAQIVVEAVLESGQSLGGTLKDMTDIARSHNG